MMLVDRQFRLPRVWSNDELKKIASLMTGEVLNVSGWKDEDKQGRFYKAYFTGATRYTISNFGGFRGFQGNEGEILLDLEKKLPDELQGAFDVVFNHTTLEHIYDMRTAFANLCALSRDIVILVVPFSQVQHETDDFKDYWRFTPTGVRRLFAENGMTVVYESVNQNFHAGLYVFSVAARSPARWRDRLKDRPSLTQSGWTIGASVKEIIRRLLRPR